MRAWLLALALCGCDHVFGIGDPYEDAAATTGPHDVQPLDIGPPLEDVGGETVAASLIVRYPFNGNMASSNGAPDAHPTGSIMTAGTGGPFTGRGYAELDGTACITFLTPQTPDTFSIVLWVESTSTVAAAAPLFARPHATTAATTRDWAFFGNSAEVEFQMLGSTGTQIYPITPGVATTWHQYAVTFDGTNVRVYSDGMIAGPVGPGMPVMYGGAGIVYLGCEGSSDGTTRFAGRFAEVQIYAGVLTDPQVMQLSVDPTPP